MAGGVDQIYVFDTSSLLELRRFVPVSDRSAVLDRLGYLVESRSLVYPAQVHEELERFRNASKPDPICDWVKKHKSKAGWLGNCYEYLGGVLSHPIAKRVLDPDKGGVEEADPYVLAMAIKIAKTVQHVRPIVVSQETKDSPIKTSIATACGALRIIRLPVLAVLEEQEIWPIAEA